jgi:hypothetical protein
MNSLKDLLLEIVSQKSLKERIDTATFDIYDYKKFDDKDGKKKTGTAFDISKVKELVVVDFDFHKDLNDEQKEFIRNDIVKKLELNEITV